MKFFSKERYLKYKRCRWDYEYHWQIRNWADMSDGKEVVNGFVNHRAVSDSWCVEVPDDLMKEFEKQMFDVAKLVRYMEGQAVNCRCSDVSMHPRYKIVIEGYESTTLATMYVDDKVIKRTAAKRRPADKFNWRIGAQTAFNRLWEKKKKPVKVKKTWLDDAVEAAAKEVAERMRKNIMAKW